MSKRTGSVKFTIRKDRKSGFTIRSRNGKVVHGDHQGYERHSGAVAGLYALQRAVNEAVDKYEKELGL